MAIASGDIPCYASGNGSTYTRRYIMTEKTRETRLRRMAARQELRLVKSRRRDPRATDYGTYVLVNDNNVIVFGAWTGRSAASLDDIERYLKGEDPS